MIFIIRDARLSEGLESIFISNSLTNSFIDRLKLAVLMFFLIKLLFFISCFYEEVYLNKPLTSRPANSEKYVVAKNFRGIELSYLSHLYALIDYWNNLNDPNSCLRIFKSNNF